MKSLSLSLSSLLIQLQFIFILSVLLVLIITVCSVIIHSIFRVSLNFALSSCVTFSFSRTPFFSLSLLQCVSSSSFCAQPSFHCNSFLCDSHSHPRYCTANEEEEEKKDSSVFCFYSKSYLKSRPFAFRSFIDFSPLPALLSFSPSAKYSLPKVSYFPLTLFTLSLSLFLDCASSRSVSLVIFCSFTFSSLSCDCNFQQISFNCSHCPSVACLPLSPSHTHCGAFILLLLLQHQL